MTPFTLNSEIIANVNEIAHCERALSPQCFPASNVNLVKDFALGFVQLQLMVQIFGIIKTYMFELILLNNHTNLRLEATCTTAAHLIN